MLGAQSELSAGDLCSSPPELLQVTRASCLVTGSKSKCPERELGKSCLTFYSLALEITSHHFHHTLITEAVAKAHPGSRKGEIASRGEQQILEELARWELLLKLFFGKYDLPQSTLWLSNSYSSHTQNTLLSETPKVLSHDGARLGITSKANPVENHFFQNQISSKGIHLPYDLAIPLLDIYRREMKTHGHTKR